MKILLVDDEQLARQELSYLLTEIKSGNDYFEASHIKAAQQMLLKEAIDVIFLDMHLQNESGMELMETVTQMKEPPFVVFATAHDDFAVRAFELDATDYILKPFDLERLQKVMGKIEARMSHRSVQNVPDKKSDASSRDKRYLPIEDEDRIVMVAMNDVYVVTTDEGEVIIQTHDKEYRMRESLKAMKEKLPEENFMQVHRAYIINLNEVEEIQPWFNRNYQVTMNNGSKVIVSRSYMQAFKTVFGLS